MPSTGAHTTARDNEMARSSRKKWLILSGVVILALAGIMFYLSYLYDLRVAAATDDGNVLKFYRNISSTVVVFCCLLLVAYVLGARSLFIAGSDRTKASFLAVVFASVSLVFGALAVWNFYDFKPKIVLSKDFLDCNYSLRLQWVDMTNVSFRKSTGRGKSDYADVKLTNAAKTAATTGNLTEACEIDGLNAPYDAVYEAILKRWRSAMLTPARVRPAQ